MPLRRFTVRWGPTLPAERVVELEEERTVLDLIDYLCSNPSSGLPAQDHRGHDIEYGLFVRGADQQYQKLEGRRELCDVLTWHVDILYLADHKQPWWLLEAEPVVLPGCTLQLHANCIVDVPVSGLTITRHYLMRALPSKVVAAERSLHQNGRDSQLSRVSRQDHCRVYYEGNSWMLKPLRTTLVDGRPIPTGVAIMLPFDHPVTVTLGSKGWPIEAKAFRT